VAPMAREDDHDFKAMEAIDLAREGLGAQPEKALVYAQIATAEAQLAVYDALIALRDDLSERR
jgi:hypothetical protein